MKNKLSLLTILTALACALVLIFDFAAPGASGAPVPMLGLVILPAILRDPVTQLEVPPYTRAQKFMFDFLRNKANGLTDDAMKQGAIIFDSITYYIRFAITGLAGRVKVLGQATLQIPGISNFYNAATLPQYYNFCFDRIEVNYGTTAVTALDSPSLCTNWSSVRSAFPAPLSNGELILSLNKNIVVNTPMTDFLSKAAVVGGGSRDFDGGDLQEPKIIQENLLFEAELNLAAGNIPSAVNTSYFVELQFKGVQARLRA